MQLQVGGPNGTILNDPRSDDGQSRAVDGPVVSHLTPDGIVSLFPSPDGKTVEVQPIAIGTASYHATADADLSAADLQISGNSISIEVIAASVPMATHIVSTEGPLVPAPPV